MTDHEIEAFIAAEEHKLRRNFYRKEFELRYLINPAKGMEPYHRQKNIWLWESALKNLWGGVLMPSARNLWSAVRNIYVLDPAGELLPLPQAIRLLDIYRLSQAKFTTIKARLTNRPPSPGARDGAPGNFHSPEAVYDELKNSLARLEAILSGVQFALQERRRHAPGRVNCDVALEAMSPEEIERQIGREIEIYSRLERETEEQLQSARHRPAR